MPGPVRKAIIPVAGWGTRMLPATRVVAKELLPILQRPLLSWILDECAAAGISEVVLVGRHHKPGFKEFVECDPALEKAVEELANESVLEDLHSICPPEITISWAFQEEPLGLGHAFLCARHIIGNEPVAGLLPDELFFHPSRPPLSQLLDEFETVRHTLVGLLEVPKSEVSRYGVAVPAGDAGKSGSFRVSGLVEKPDPETAPSTWMLPGRYILTPAVFSELDRTKPSALGEIQLTSALNAVAQSEGVWGLPVEGVRFDTGTTDGYLAANTFAKLYMDASMDDAARQRFLSNLEKEGRQWLALSGR